MRRAVIVARLKEGTHDQAVALVGNGPPFDPAEVGFRRHAVYLTEHEVIFLFEGTDAEWRVDDLASSAFHPLVQGALDAWRPLVDGTPHLARELFFWEWASEQ